MYTVTKNIGTPLGKRHQPMHFRNHQYMQFIKGKPRWKWEMVEILGFLQVVTFLIAEGVMMCPWQISECSNQAITDSKSYYEVDDDDESTFDLPTT